MTAPTIFLILLGKFALSAALFVGMFSFGLWLGRIGFTNEGKND